MDVAKARRTGNCRRLNSKGITVQAVGIRGMNTSSRFEQSVKIIVSITLSFSYTVSYHWIVLMHLDSPAT